MRFQHTEPDPEKLLTTSKLYYIAYRLYKGRITFHQALLEFAAWVDQDFREDIAQAPLSRKLLFFLAWILARVLLSGYRGGRWLFLEQIFLKALVPYLLLPIYSFLTLKWVRLLFSPRELRRELLKELEKELENRGFSPTGSRVKLSFQERAELLVFDLFYHLAGLSELTRAELYRRSRKTIFLLTSLVVHLLILFILSYQKPTRYDLSEGETLDLDSIELVEIGTLKQKAKRKPALARKQTPAAKLLKKIARLKPERQQPKPPTPSRERIPHEPEPAPPFRKPQPELQRKIAMIQKRTAAIIKKPPVSKTKRARRRYRKPSFKPKKMMPAIAEKSSLPGKKLLIPHKIALRKAASARKIKTPVLSSLSPEVRRPPGEQSGSPGKKISRVFKKEIDIRHTQKLLPSAVTERQTGKTVSESAVQARKSRTVLKMSDIGRRRIDLSRDRELSSRKFEISSPDRTEIRPGAAKPKLAISKMSLEESPFRKTRDSGSALQRKIRPQEKLIISERKDSDFKLGRSEHVIKDKSGIDRSRKFQEGLITDLPDTLENRLQEAFSTETKKLSQKSTTRKRTSLTLPFMEDRSKLPITDIHKKRLSGMVSRPSVPRQRSDGFLIKRETPKSVSAKTAVTSVKGKLITRTSSYEELKKANPEITIENPGNDVEISSSRVSYLASTGKQSFSAVETKDNLKMDAAFQPETVSVSGKTRTLAAGSRIAETREKTLLLADKRGQALEKLLETTSIGRRSIATKKPDKRKLESMKIVLNLPSGLITKEALHTLTGRMDKETKMAWIKVNGVTQLAAVVGGRLVAELTMKKGINEIEVTAFSSSGSFGKKKIKLLFRPPRQLPVITLISPSVQVEKAEKGQLILVKGEIDDPSITRAVLFLNRRPVILSVKKGKFSQKVVLPGKRLNTFRVMATNRMGVKGYSPLHTVLVGASINVMNPRPF